MVKRAAKQLLDSGINFDDKFKDNKKILGKTMHSKPIRNRIAGYIARLKKAEALRLTKPVVQTTPQQDAETQ